MMLLAYCITIKGEPVAQARVRSNVIWPKDDGIPRLLSFFKRKAWVNHYTPAKSLNFKKLLQEEIARQGLPSSLWEDPLVLECRIYKTKPKTAKRMWLTTKPDLDNYLKAVKDAMTGLVYTDDSIVVGYKDCWKLYTDDKPRIEIILWRAGT